MTQNTIQLADFAAAWAQNSKAYLEAVERVGKSGWLILGKEVSTFERDLAAFWGLRFAVGVANGLDALEISFRALGAQPGDRFLTTPLTAFATTLAILRVGGIPEFVDVDASGLMDLNLARARLAQTEKPIRFVVPVHLFGHALSLKRLEALASEFGVQLVEDCAQAIGARSDGKSVGSASACCATSFYPTKNLGAFGDGGALLTNNEDLFRMAQSLRDYGQTEKYLHTNVGLNSRLDELHAAILHDVQLPLLAAQTSRRKAIAARYTQELRNQRVVLPPVPAGSDSVWHLFPVLIQGNRKNFRDHLAQQGVSTGIHYPTLVNHQPALRSVMPVEFPKGALPMAERFADCEVSLPMHPFLTDSDCERVINACNSWEA
jgi:dTDP-4-amino-4,6-dideoxygalactose transaminase